jgi:hypothetical protein
VYGWGQAEWGAIGMRLSNSSYPISITVGNSEENVKDISCGAKYSCFLSSKHSHKSNLFILVTGEVYACG